MRPGETAPQRSSETRLPESSTQTRVSLEACQSRSRLQPDAARMAAEIAAVSGKWNLLIRDGLWPPKNHTKIAALCSVREFRWKKEKRARSGGEGLERARFL